jgi:hypothetical protein
MVMHGRTCGPNGEREDQDMKGRGKGVGGEGGIVEKGGLTA